MGDMDFTQSARTSWLDLRPGVDMTGFDIGMRVRRLALILTARLDAAAARYGFSSFGDYEVLAAIRREGQPLQPSALAQILMLTRAGITGRLNRLEAQRLIKRTKAKPDARSVLVSLTADGRRCVDDAFAAMHDERGVLFEPLSDVEQQHLADLLRTVLLPIDDSPSLR